MILLVLALVLALGAAPVFAGQHADDTARLEAFIGTQLAEQKIPGAAVAVIRDGKTILAKGFGEASVEHRVAVTPDTIFQSGSVGKQFTAAAALLLVEDGKLALDDPLTKFFPDAPSRWSGITVRHLLTHTSGLPDYTSGTIDYRKDYTEADLLKMAYDLTPEFAPGSRWNYSNTGYVVLGILIGKAGGQFYGDLLRERVFTPLGMKTARVISEADIVPHRADGYRLVDGELKHDEWVAPALNTTADGSLYLSLNDMVAWDAGIRERRVLKPESWALALTPVKLASGRTYPYGFGWRVTTRNDRRVEAHGGAWQGFQSYIARYPDDGLSVIALTNLAQGDPERIVEGIAAMLVPALASRELTPIGDADPALQARVRALIESARAGTLKPEEFAYVRAGFFPNATRRFVRVLGESGALTSMALLEVRELGDDTVYTWDVTFEKSVRRLRLAVAPDGRIAGFDLR